MMHRKSAVISLLVMSVSTLTGGCQESAKIHMVWKGVEEDTQVWQSALVDTTSGLVWEPQSGVTDAKTSDGPAITSFSAADVPSGQDYTDPPLERFIAWRGAGDDQALYWKRIGRDGSEAGPARIPGVGSSRGPALAAQPFQYIYMAWKGIAGDQGIYWSYNNLFHGALGWAPQAKVPGVGTSERPALAYRPGHLCMAWKGVEGDAGIYVACNGGGSTWEPQRRVPDVGTSRGPALVYFNAFLHLVWKGVGDDQGVYHASSADDGHTWTKQERLEGFGTSDSPALCVFNYSIYMAWKGVGGDAGLYWSRSRDGSTWDEQHQVPNVGSSNGPGIAID